MQKKIKEKLDTRNGVKTGNWRKEMALKDLKRDFIARANSDKEQMRDLRAQIEEKTV